MEFRFSIEIKQEGQIKQEPGIFNLVLSAQRHTHGELHLGTREEALSWGEDPRSLWRQLWEALPEPIGISTCPPGFHVFCPFLHLSVSLWEEAQNSTHRKHWGRGSGGSHSPALPPCLPRGCGFWGLFSRPLQNVLPFPYKSLTSLLPPTTPSLSLSLSKWKHSWLTVFC